MRLALVSLIALLLAPPVSARAASRREIALPGDRFFPEGVAAASDGTLFVGSLREGRIVRIAPDGAVAEHVPPGGGDLVSAAGLRVDEARGLLWACSSDPGVGVRTGKAAPALKAFDLRTGVPKGSWVLPGGGFCNDVAVAADGTVFVTDSFGARVLRLAPGATSLAVHASDPRFGGAGFGLNGIVASTDGALFVVQTNTGVLWRIDAKGHAAPVALQRPLVAPDGLVALPDGALLVVETGSLARIDPGSGRVTTLAAGLLGPTTVALRGGEAVVAQGQLDKLFDPQHPAPAPFSLAVVPLGR